MCVYMYVCIYVCVDPSQHTLTNAYTQIPIARWATRSAGSSWGPTALTSVTCCQVRWHLLSVYTFTHVYPCIHTYPRPRHQLNHKNTQGSRRTRRSWGTRRRPCRSIRTCGRTTTPASSSPPPRCVVMYINSYRMCMRWRGRDTDPTHSPYIQTHPQHTVAPRAHPRGDGQRPRQHNARGPGAAARHERARQRRRARSGPRDRCVKGKHTCYFLHIQKH